MIPNLYKLAKKSRRPKNPANPSVKVCVTLAVAQVEYLSQSDKSLSSRVADAVDLLMKQEGYVPGPARLAPGVKPVPDPVEFAELVGDHAKVKYLDLIGGYSDAEVCHHVGIGARDLRTTRKDLAFMAGRQREQEVEL